MKTWAMNSQVFIVVDTNVFISQLDLIKTLEKESVQFDVCIMVPWKTLQELDTLKSDDRIGRDARAAIEFIFIAMQKSNARVAGQKYDPNYDLFNNQDDVILDCCAYYSGIGKHVVFMTNDKNLAIKSNVRNFLTIFEWKDSVQNLMAHIREKFLARDLDLMEIDLHEMDPSEGMQVDKKHESKVFDELKRNVEKNFEPFIVETLRNYLGESWKDLIEYKAPFNAHELFSIMDKLWISVFCNVFPRSARDVLEETTKHFRRSHIPNEESELIERMIRNVEFIKKCVGIKF